MNYLYKKHNCIYLLLFSRQGKSRWQARFASVRLGSRAPWEQKERIVGMVKTPVEGNSIVILKMEKPVFFSDFARPICLPSSDEFIHMGATCVTLGWSGQSKFLSSVLFAWIQESFNEVKHKDYTWTL